LAVRSSQCLFIRRDSAKHDEGERHVYAEVDWSTDGAWHHHRRLFVLNGIASDITALVMETSSTDVRTSRMPHHIFQSRVIVDAFAVCRGWTLSPLLGHVLAAPSRDFRPRRDVDLFLDREVKRNSQGLLQSIDILKQLLQKDTNLRQDPD
tara:strand:- start:1396 stop:1848 length:453 start_codon:yes stop_codon:yes gene_type:complete